MLLVVGFSTGGKSISETMSSEDLIKQFWQKDKEQHFTPSETRLFFALVQMVGSGEMVMSDAEIAASVGVCLAVMRKARKRLADVGLIVVSSGNGRGCKTVYRLSVEDKVVPQPEKPKEDAAVESVQEPERAIEQADEQPPALEEVKPKRTRTARPKDGDLFGKTDMRPKRASVPVEVEPPDMEDVVIHFIAQGVPREVAETFYYHYDSLGWITNSGVKVKRWQSLANKWITKEKQEYGSKINQSGDTFKQNIAERVARAEREYREAVGH